MKKGLIVLSCFCYMLTAPNCKSKQTIADALLTSDTLKFFPVKQYFTNEIHNIDTGNAFMYKITIDDKNVRDSSVLNKQQCIELTRAFTAEDISDKSIHRFYKENVFKDETTHSITFNYTALDTSLPLQRVDVLLDENDQHVTRVFLTRNIVAADSTITEKAGWKTGSSFFYKPGNLLYR